LAKAASIFAFAIPLDIGYLSGTQHKTRREGLGYVVPPPAVISLPIRATEDRFPVRRIYCVGRNYAAHAVEMGHDPDREPPFFFQKNPDNLVLDGRFPYPPRSHDVHHEIELVVALKEGGRDIAPEHAQAHVFGYAVGIDMTQRDLQAEAKAMGRPWEVGKAFEHSALCGELVPARMIGHPERGAIWLDVNGKRRQEGDLAQLIWKVPEVIAELSRLFTLAPGDLIMTGTPAGVGAVAKGDVMRGGVKGVGEITAEVI
jgi:fumarylpyruvate hydrolase